MKQRKKGPKPEETCYLCRTNDGDWTDISFTHGTKIPKPAWWCHRCNGWVTTLAEAMEYLGRTR